MKLQVFFSSFSVILTYSFFFVQILAFWLSERKSVFMQAVFFFLSISIEVISILKILCLRSEFIVKRNIASLSSVHRYLFYPFSIFYIILVTLHSFFLTSYIFTYCSLTSRIFCILLRFSCSVYILIHSYLSFFSFLTCFLDFFSFLPFSPVPFLYIYFLTYCVSPHFSHSPRSLLSPGTCVSA